MKPGNGESDAHDAPDSESAEAPQAEGADGRAADAPDSGGAEPEATGLTGVDAPALAPLSREEVEELRRECSELRDQVLRRRAEFENYRRRVERDRAQAGVDAITDLLREMVPTLDNLERALEAQAGEGSLREGVELTYRDLMTLLAARGVEVDVPQGQPFDPNRHQALSHEAAPGFPEGAVVEVFRKGYSFKGRLLRPALVKVAKGEGDAESTDGESKAGSESVH